MRTKNIFLFIIALIAISFKASAHWTTKGPYGGKISCLYAADTLLYIGSVDGGVYRSTSSAANAWRYANYTGLTHGQINDIVQIGNTILAATPVGVFRSGNIGDTWTGSNSGIPVSASTHRFIYTGTRVLVATSMGMSKSDDGGNTWSTVAGAPNSVSCFAYDGTRIFAGTTGNGVFVSTNNGDTWTAVNTGLTDLSILSLEVSGGNIFAGTLNGIFISSASTVSWSPGNTGLVDLAIYSLSVSGGNVYAGTGNGVFVSADVSPSWTAANTGYTGPVTALEIFNGKIYLGTAEDGIYKSNSLSSISWIRHNNGFNNLEAYTVYNDGLLLITSTNKGLFVSRDLGASFIAANNGLNDSTTVRDLCFAGPDLYAATSGGVYKSTDTGQTWTPVNTGLIMGLNMRQICATPTHLVASTGSGFVFTTPLTAINWTEVVSLSMVNAQEIIATGPTTVFIATLGDGIYRTTDLVNWTNVNPGLTATDISSLAIKGGDIYAGTLGNGIYKSSLSSFSWSAVNTGLPSMDITALYSAGQWVVAGFMGNVYATYNDGASWEPTNVMDYIPEYAYIYDISFTTASTRIFVTTPHNTVYSNGIAELPVGITERGNEMFFSISPNPSNGNFNIRLKQLNENIENITITDINGKMVGSIPSAKGSVSVNVSMELAKGIYLVKVHTSTGMFTQKLVVE